MPDKYVEPVDVQVREIKHSLAKAGIDATDEMILEMIDSNQLLSVNMEKIRRALRMR